MSFRRIRAVFVKELHHITRDSRSLLLALAMPVMMLLLYGYALSLDVDHIPALVYDQDGTSASRDLVRQFQGSRFFDIKGFAAGYGDSIHSDARQCAAAGRQFSLVHRRAAGRVPGVPRNTSWAAVAAPLNPDPDAATGPQHGDRIVNAADPHHGANCTW